jgi:isopenicillin N synthase-like dioxygenase
MSPVPLIDLTDLRVDPTSAGARRGAEELGRGAHEHGCWYIGGHGVDPALDEAIAAEARRFFALPLADRLAIENVNSPQFRGYTRSGGEYTAGRPDRREQIDIGPEDDAPVLAPDSPRWMRLRGPNLWPSAQPSLRPAVEAWLAAMAEVGDLVLRALALALGQPIDHFDPIVAPRSDFRLKIIGYPGSDDADEQQGLGAHRDAGFLSIILQDDVGGLQVHEDGVWHDVPHVTGTYVVNVGEMVQLLTHGYVGASMHRVVSPSSGRDRLSIAYFHNPALHATLAPVALPPALAALAPGGASTDPSNPILANFGENTLKVRLRSHPDVAARHHADLLGAG